jgi:phosphoenolpyruvate carboxylase
VVAARARVAAQRSAAALDELILLRKKEMENKLTEEHYRRELERIRQSFQTNMRQLDDKSAFISEVRRRVHTAETEEELRDNLLLLGGDGPRDLTAEDLRKLLLGEGTLEV